MRHLLFLICLLSITSCNLDKDRHFYLNKELKTYFDYKLGRYWVYHDDALNLTDTHKIVQHWSEMRGEHSDTYFDYQESISITYATTNDIIIYDQLEATNTNYSLMHRTFNSEKPNNTYFRDEIEMSIYGGTFNADSNYMILADYTVNGIKYTNVLHYINDMCINNYKSGLTETVKVEYFIAKNIGVIEKRYSSPTETQCWKLVSYHLN